ncbi:MAG: ribosome maturation factor RimP [Armatimonadetes bacterium]|nr:ribosome maturation factor RimP [Armatimonadota bacterium]
MVDWSTIESDLTTLLEGAGYELVELQKTTGRGAHVTILADKLDAPGTINLDECAELSFLVSQYLDQVDPIRGTYRLMVSSPGVDRPLRKPAHYERAVDKTVRVRHTAGEGPVTIQGRLAAVSEDGITIDVDGVQHAVPWQCVERAHLVYDWGD